MPLRSPGQIDPATATPMDIEAASPRDGWMPRGRRVAGVIAGFLIGQGAAQLLTVLAGFFLVRHLNVQAYAQLGLALGFQATFSTLMDLGFAGTIVPLVGRGKDDRALVGRYVRAAKHLRDRSFFALAPIAILASLGIMHRQHWPAALQAELLLSTLVALYFSGKAAYFSAVLIMHGELRRYYVLQVLAGLLRLGAYILLASLGLLSAWAAAAIGAVVVVFTAQSYARQANALMEWPQHDDPATGREIIRFVIPAVPAMVFAAFQAQLTLFLISIFGRQEAYIAQVAALSRLFQIFTVLTTFNLMVVEPFMARRTRHQLLPSYLTLTSIASCIAVPVVYSAFAWPRVFLFLLGPKYAGLRDLMGWVILAATLNYLANLLWMMNRGRRWVFWSGSVVEVGLLTAAQVAFVVLVGVSTTRDAIYLTVITSICVLIAHAYVSLLGFWRLLRDRKDGTSSTPLTPEPFSV